MELAGSLADLGTMLPLLIPLIIINGINATIALLVVGLTYVAVGFYYKIPIPVQPLKAVAIIAIAGGFSAETIAAAGIIMGLFMLVLAATGLVDQLSRVFTKPVIRGIQVALGLLLIIRGANFMIDNRLFIDGGIAFSGSVNPNLLIGMAGVIIGAVLINSRRFPAALVLIGLGSVLGVLFLRPELKLGPGFPSISMPSLRGFRDAFIFLVIPQIPVTISNAVISTSDLSKKYFKNRAARVTPRALTTSIGVADLAAGSLGGMPICHGSGGLVAHRRFGARSGGAPVLIGVIFLFLALAVGSGAASILNLLPLSILGVLLLFTGLQMMMLAVDVKKKQDFMIVSLIAGLAVALNMTVAFISGILVYNLLRKLEI